jgi:hypothetical protein
MSSAFPLPHPKSSPETQSYPSGAQRRGGSGETFDNTETDQDTATKHPRSALPSEPFCPPQGSAVSDSPSGLSPNSRAHTAAVRGGGGRGTSHFFFQLHSKTDTHSLAWRVPKPSHRVVFDCKRLLC